MEAPRIDTVLTVIVSILTIAGAGITATTMVKDVDAATKINGTRIGALESAIIKIESKLDYLVEGQGKLRSDVQELKVGVGHVKETLKNGRSN